ncbi:class IV lanthionine synthetase LanL [Rhizohabitans arisaemae]|uniref:class IV lanthionine synthetase LanL n=1 Tax=Rhizohabitans arisaemae TaxID=2720610 RepID=UPI0024B0B404|nr:class IV lanthionine synthetase LanL [Rhizohabitans arisaemae]
MSAGTAEVPLLPVVLAALAGAPDRDAWEAVRWEHGNGFWIRVRHLATRVPYQGWKIHVSSWAGSAEDVLRRALAVLIGERATFKVAGSNAVLHYLNSGRGGASQVGKFITVYPQDDGHAVRLARALDDAVGGLRGPGIPSDRPVRAGSLVHYRYGAFVGGRELQTPIGEIVSALVDGDGRLVPDSRQEFYVAPAWVADPFLDARVSADPPEPSPLIDGRYLVLGTLHRSQSSSVHLGVDLDAKTRVVVKRARRDSLMGMDGRDGRDRLRTEAALLRRLDRVAAVPRVRDLVAADDEVMLVLEDVPGMTLEERVAELQRYGRRLPVELAVRWGRALAATLHDVHRAGVVHSDVKPANILVSSDESLHLIDFNIAVDPAEEAGRAGDRGGTRGYVSPQQLAGEAATVADDVYGLGCVLYYAVTGAQPSHTPTGARPRPISLLNPAVPAGFREVVDRCLDADPALRFPSMADLGRALAAGHGSPAADEVPAEAAERRRSRELASRLAETLCAAGRPSPHGDGLVWLSAHASGRGTLSRDLCLGGAGAVLALAELTAEFGRPELADALAAGARWLEIAPAPGGDPLPGLYVGESGIGAALLRAGQVLGDDRLVDAALARGRAVAALPHASPDLYNGTAGRLRFHLLLYDATGEDECLRAARAAADVVAGRAERSAAGGCFWTFPDGYGEMSGHAYLGYAHGAAGIADALIDLVEITGDTRHVPVVAGAAAWIADSAVDVLDDGQGLGWPARPGTAPSVPFWCHGAAGIGHFLLRSAARGLVPGARDLAERAALATAWGARFAGPSRCHGLAGNIEFLLDAYQATGEVRRLREARVLARLLDAFAVDRDGRLAWSADVPDLITPDYMVGYPGIALTLLRLADPDRRPGQLGLAGFRHAAAPAGPAR